MVKKKNLAYIALAGTLALTSCGTREDADYHEAAMNKAMEIVGDTVETNYVIEDSITYRDGKGRQYLIYHPEGQPTQRMTIHVPRLKSKGAFVQTPD